MTLTNDMINGAFEFTGSLFLLRNCWTLYEDKEVKGVSPWSTIYFFSWAVWNLFFYPALHQHWSWIGGMCIGLSQFIWILLVVWYRLSKPVSSSVVQVAFSPNPADSPRQASATSAGAPPAPLREEDLSAARRPACDRI